MGIFLAAGRPARADDVLVHSFAGGTGDGEFPVGDPVVSGGTLFGLTNVGGTSNAGTIYQLNAAGGGLKILHSFSSGRDPSGSLALAGSMLYGMTNTTGGFGEIFRIATSGAGYVSIHNFVGGTMDGRAPLGSLLLVGSTLYGMTQRGGANDVGTIFSIGTDGTGFTLLHSFAGTDGSYPEGALAFSGGRLYGMTNAGTNGAVVFAMDPNGANFVVLHTFGLLGDGASPQGSVIVDGSTLYGTTSSGGQFGSGTVFAIGTDGSSYALLHDFAGGTTDGALPSGSLTQVGTTLYGTSQSGGANGAGTVFQIGTDGTGFQIAHSFAGATADGQSPQGSLTASDGYLFGTTAGGGASGLGTVFVLGNALPSAPPPSVTTPGVTSPNPALLGKLRLLKKKLAAAKKIADPAVRATKVKKLKKKIAALKKRIAAGG
jgi:uncharacterized repeat protein (TIGR03803 family)